MIFDADQTGEQFIAISLEQQFELTMPHFRTWEFFDFIRVEIQYIAKSGIMNIFVAVGYKDIELATNHLLFGHIDHSAETTAHRIDDKFELVLVALFKLDLSRDVSLCLESSGGLSYVAEFGVFNDRPNGKGFGGVSLANANLFHEFGCAFDDAFGVVFEVGGGDEINTVENGRVEAKEVLLVLSNSLVVELIKLIHASHYLPTQILQFLQTQTLLCNLLPELYLQLEYFMNLSG